MSRSSKILGGFPGRDHGCFELSRRCVRRQPDQGHRGCRGRAREHAGRLRPGGGPERHGRFDAQLALHAAEPDWHAGAPGRQRARPGPGNQERRRRDGNGDPAALRDARLAYRCRRIGAGRLQKPAGRDLAGDPAAGRRQRGVRRGAGARRDRCVCRLGRRHQRHEERPHLRAHLVGRDRRTRDPVQPRRHAHGSPVAAQSRLHDRPPHCAGDQRPSGRRWGHRHRSRQCRHCRANRTATS